MQDGGNGDIDRYREPLAGLSVSREQRVRFDLRRIGVPVHRLREREMEMVGRAGLQRREARGWIGADADLHYAVRSGDHVEAVPAQEAIPC